MATPILAITDGTTRVSLLTSNSGINACNYEPGRPAFKDDGGWADSSLSDGRQLQMRKWTNIVDVFTLIISGDSQDAIIEDARNLTMLLEKAVSYWTTEWQNEPVWIERRGSKETNISHALIHAYKWENDSNPFAPPFYVPSKPYAMDGVTLAVEHSPWMANPPGESDCVELSTLAIGEVEEVACYPESGGDDAYIHTRHKQHQTESNYISTSEDDLSVRYYGEGASKRELGIRFKSVPIIKGATIVSAHVEFRSTLNVATALVTKIEGQLDKRGWGEVYPPRMLMSGMGENRWSTSSMTPDGNTILAAVENNYLGWLWRSTDGGANWTDVSPAVVAAHWKSSAMSSDGNVILAGIASEGVGSSRLHLSLNGGSSWTEVQPAGDNDFYWWSCDMSSNGATMFAASSTIYDGGRLYVSKNTGASWAETRPAGNINRHWNITSVSSDGSVMLAGALQSFGAGYLYVSTNGGTNWTRVLAGVGDSWRSSSMSSDGNVILAGTTKRLYLSINSGASWAEVQPAGDVDRYWKLSSMSSDGNIILVGAYSGYMYLSLDKGVSWEEIQGEEGVAQRWVSASMSSDGKTMLAGASDRLLISVYNTPAAEFTGFSEFISRARTNNSTSWGMEQWGIGTLAKTPDISSVISEIVSADNWASGKDIALFIKQESGTGENRFSSFENDAVYDKAKLVISYSLVQGDYGHEPTCDDEVYVANKNSVFQVTEVFSSIHQESYFSPNLQTEPLPTEILASPHTKIFFGSSYPFCSLVFDLSQTGKNVVQWDYYDGAAWKPLTVMSDVDGYDQFAVNGVGVISWLQPDDWSTVSVNGTDQYWVRARFATLNTRPIQNNRLIYTVTQNSVKAGEIGGDITALANVTIASTNAEGGNPSKILMSTRSSHRGKDFSPYINSSEQNNLLITTSGDNAIVSPSMPAGSVRRTEWPGVAAPERRWGATLKSPLSLEYYGRYRAYARAHTTASISDGDVSSYLEITLGASRRTKMVYNRETRDNFHYFDYGIVSIPPATLPAKVTFGGAVTIDVYAGNTYGAMDFDWIDLVLVPVDEYALEINQRPTSNVGDVTLVDSTTYIGKGNAFSTLRRMADYEIHDIPNIVAPAPIQLQAGVEQRVFFFVIEDSAYEWVGRVQMRSNERYLTFRGDK